MPSNAKAGCPARHGLHRWPAGAWRLATAALLWVLAGLAAPAAAAPSLQAALDAADQAEVAIRAQMDPPVQRQLLEEMKHREYTCIHRHLARERARQALDALRLLARWVRLRAEP